jgi:DNA sulfur modification protein DndC
MPVSSTVRRETPEASLLQETRETLRRNYFADNRPWVVAYSGGKDSTLVLQLTYELLLEFGDQAHKPVHVVASDTRVEAPNIEDYLADTIGRLEYQANQSHLPLHIHLVKPAADEGFWFNLIGKGYPSPTRWFRWCTTKMKIKPARRVIETITRRHSSVILLLGTRLEESSSRSQRMEARESNSRGLNPHHEIPNALVLTPIAHWSTDEVWEYLFTHNPPPWGGNHDFMLNLYR